MKVVWLKGKNEGRMEAEEYLQARMTQICKANHQLLVEIMRLDKKESVVGVLIPYEFAERVVRKLRKRNRNDHHAKMVKYYMKKSDGEVFGDMDMSDIPMK